MDGFEENVEIPNIDMDEEVKVGIEKFLKRRNVKFS